MSDGDGSRGGAADLLDRFDRTERPGEPLTASEVAADLEASREAVADRLESLVAADALRAKAVGSDTRVYWPSTDPSAGSRDGSEAESEPDRAASDAPEGRDSERKFRAVFEGAFDAMVIADDDARYVDANPAACDLFGLPRDELLGQTVRDFAPEDYDFDRAWRSFQESDRNRGIFPLLRPDGERRLVEFAATPGILAGRHLSVLRDVTDRERRKRELEASNERLEGFAYAVSHDLEEPLRTVTSYLELLERRYDDALDETGREFLESAVGGAERMQEMIAGLLEYSRIDARTSSFHPVDLDAVLEDVLEDLRLQRRETGAEITVESLPAVRGDDRQLRRLFQNLLSNALEYSGDEPPRIRVSAERDDGWWRIAVSDEGIGISPEDQDRIFEVFERLHGPEEHAGTGVGLALCERIVEGHDGEIKVDSEAGEGATFSFTLPAVRDSTAAVE